ncbi:MAG: hypothetical protein RRC34_11285 [Lentisphaeria bacterium]|nr:hypothetical protein [Lentisphaeria bacterium]
MVTFIYDHAGCFAGFHAVLAAALLLAGCGGGDYPGQLKRLREQAAEQALAEATAALDPAEVARELGVPWPAPKPRMTALAVKNDVNARVKEVLDETYPVETLERLREETVAKYALVKTGDTVEFMINGGAGVNPVAKGVFFGTTETGRFKIGSTTYHPDEFSPDDLAKLDPEVHERRVELEYRRKVFLVKDNRRLLGQKLFNEQLPPAMRDAGFARTKDGGWIAMRALVEKRLAEKAAEHAKKREPDVRERLFKANGFVIKDGEWKPSLKKRVFGK